MWSWNSKQNSCVGNWSHVFSISYHISNLMFTYVWSSLIVTDCAFSGCFQQCSDSMTNATVSKPAVCVSVCQIGKHSSGQMTWPQPQPVLSAIIWSTVWKAGSGQRKSACLLHFRSGSTTSLLLYRHPVDLRSIAAQCPDDETWDSHSHLGQYWTSHFQLTVLQTPYRGNNAVQCDHSRFFQE